MTRSRVLTLIESFVGQANVLSIPREVIRFFGDDIEVALFFSQLIYWHGRAGPDGIAKSYHEWSEEIGLKIHKVRRIVRELTDSGMIKTKLKMFAGRPVLHFTVNAEKFADDFSTFLTNSQKHDADNLRQVCKIEETTTDSSSNTTEQLLPPPKHPPHSRRDVPYDRIVESLNQKTGSRFRNTATTQRHISARWREGFRLEDFEKVIANMSSRWKGDPRMEMYLRPQTLFGTKFESYLNAREGERNGHFDARTTGNKGSTEGKYTGLGDIVEV